MLAEGQVDPKHFKEYIHKRQIDIKKANMPILNNEHEGSKEILIDKFSSHDQFNLFSREQLAEMEQEQPHNNTVKNINANEADASHHHEQINIASLDPLNGYSLDKSDLKNKNMNSLVDLADNSIHSVRNMNMDNLNVEEMYNFTSKNLGENINETENENEGN